jgi:hypothetical protein
MNTLGRVITLILVGILTFGVLYIGYNWWTNRDDKAVTTSLTTGAAGSPPPAATSTTTATTICATTFDDVTLGTITLDANAGDVLSMPAGACSVLFRFTNAGHTVNLASGEMAIGWTGNIADVYETSGAARTITMNGYDAIRILPQDRTLATSWHRWAVSQGTALVASLTYK